MHKFWMVFCEGARSPTRKHTSLESARAEAQRLLVSQVGPNPAIVYVLEAVEVGRLQTTHWEPLVPDPNALPF